MADTLQQTNRQGGVPAETAERTRARVVHSPRVDILEDKDNIVLYADMPGVAPDDVDITLEKRVLTIYGRGAAHEHPGYRKVYGEYGEGDFQRSFTLSDEIDQENIQASLANGVLRLTLPKAAPAKAKKIELKAS